MLRHSLDRFFATKTAEWAGAHQRAIQRCERKRRLNHGFFRVGCSGKYHYADLQFVFLREFVVALVMRGYGHNRAGAVIHEDVICNPDGYLFAVIRINRAASGIDTVFVDGADVTNFFRLTLFSDQLVDLPAQIGVARGQVRHDGMLGRKLYRSRAIDRVHAGGENADIRTGATLELESHQRAFTAANPVTLHEAHFFRPVLELVQIAEQFLGVFSDSQEPLLEFALLDKRIFVPPATAVDDLLIGQHGRALRTPVDLALLAIGQSALVELEEEPLVPAVVLRQTGRDLTRPVVGEPKALHLRLHIVDIVQGPLARRHVVRNGRVFRRQTERIPSHGMEHVVAVHPHVAGERVADRIITNVAHVKHTRRIRQHFQHVILGQCGSGFGAIKRIVLLPTLIPLRLDALRVVALVVAVVAGSGFVVVRHEKQEVLSINSTTRAESPLIRVHETQLATSRLGSMRGFLETQQAASPPGGLVFRIVFVVDPVRWVILNIIAHGVE